MDKNKWDLILDKNCYQSRNIYNASASDDGFLISGHELSLLNYSPESLHEKLLTGQLSKALDTLLCDPNIDAYLPELSSVFGQASLTRDDLTDMVHNLRVLENYTACTTLNERQAIRSSVDFPVIDTGLYSTGQGNFIENSQSKKGHQKNSGPAFQSGKKNSWLSHCSGDRSY